MTDNRQIKRIAILGGGTAGWMAASMLARALPGSGCTLTVIESPDIGTIGVGEATIPPFADLLRFLNINEEDFVKFTGSTYKLGIRFKDWSAVGQSYWHPFGTFGTALNLRPFHHAWHKARDAGLNPRFNDFSLSAALADAGKFRFPDSGAGLPIAGLRYAYHFDAGLVARYLSLYAEKLGVARLSRTLQHATRSADGLIDELVFADGDRLKADLYIDCSGFRGILIEQTLQTGYRDWSSVLPCDRAVAIPSEALAPRPPYTEAIALPAGWRWRIPLQHRTGNGYVYSSAHIDDDRALQDLLAQIGEKPLAEPRFLRFTAGRRRLFWNRNCVAFGLASGFLEPLESTSIHLVMSGVYKLLEHFPTLDFAQANTNSYNRELIAEMECIRDFIVLHYCLTERSDSALWTHCRSMQLPETLEERIELYRRTGRIRTKAGDLFTDLSWFYIFEGLGVRPERHDPLLDVVPLQGLRDTLSSLAQATAAAVHASPSHDSFFNARLESR